jgi:hypothetical protein
MKGPIKMNLKIAAIIAFVIINVQSAEKKDISVAEDVIMNVYQNEELTDREFDYWKLRGWIPEEIGKSWMRLDCMPAGTSKCATQRAPFSISKCATP